MDREKLVFISYAREDAEHATAIYHFLRYSGFRPWMDKIDLVGGQNWEHKIARAVRDCDFFVFLASRHSVSKRGAVQREIKQALRMWSDRLEDDIFLIPVRLEPCDVPGSLSQFQWIDYFGEDGRWQLERALRQGVLQLTGAATLPPLRMEGKAINESVAGKYSLQITYPSFAPSLEPGIAYINATIEDFAAKCAARFRNHCRRNQLHSPETHSELPWGLSVRLDVDYLGRDLVSVLAREDVYTGGAHPNHAFRTFVFTRRPPSMLDITDLFVDEEVGIQQISAVAISELERQLKIDCPELPSPDDWIRKGAGPDPRNFKHFTLSKDELRLYFDPYQVGAYAWGERYVNISLALIEENLRSEVKESLREQVEQFSPASEIKP